MVADSQAPRFHAYLQRIERRSVLTMPRAEWDALQLREGTPVLLDVAQTPMGGIASDASILAAVADRFSSGSAQISIYRYDPNDMPTPVNVDEYWVWENLPRHRSYDQIVAAASTEDNDNLRSYLRQNVFIVRKDPGSDHWLSDLPASIRSIVRST